MAKSKKTEEPVAVILNEDSKKILKEAGRKMTEDGISVLRIDPEERPCENYRKETEKYRWNDSVDHPEHYHPGTYEAINVIEAWDLGFCLGNAVKYIARAGHKGDVVTDLEKAIWYIRREIKNRITTKVNE